MKAKMKDKTLVIYLHDGSRDGWIIGTGFDRYKVTNNALVLMSKSGAWVAWYNLDDIQKWIVE
ncbi:MAG: hypothetical protein ACOYBC_05355 [Bilifractor sp.]